MYRRSPAPYLVSLSLWLAESCACIESLAGLLCPSPRLPQSTFRCLDNARSHVKYDRDSFDATQFTNWTNFALYNN